MVVALAKCPKSKQRKAEVSRETGQFPLKRDLEKVACWSWIRTKTLLAPNLIKVL